MGARPRRVLPFPRPHPSQAVSTSGRWPLRGLALRRFWCDHFGVPPAAHIAAAAPPDEERSLFALVRTFVLLLVLPVAIFAGLVSYGHFARATASPAAPGAPGELVWGNGTVIFSSKAQVAAWLRLHGGTLQTFLKQHPAAAGLLTKRPRPAHTTKAAPRHSPRVTTTPAAPRPAPSVKHPAVAAAAPATTHGASALLFWFAGGLGVLLGAFALVPSPLARRLRRGLDVGRDVRFSAAAAAIALLVGVACGSLLG